MVRIEKFVAVVATNAPYHPPEPPVLDGRKPTDLKALCAVDGRDPPPPAGNPEVVADVIGRAYWLVYEDSSGDESERRITLRSIERRNDVHYLRAYCHERKAPRSFRADRAIEMVDLTSGEICGNVDQWCRQFAVEAQSQNRDPIADLMQKLRYELALLAFLAKCDGRVTSEEIDLIVDFVLDHGNRAQMKEQSVRRAVMALQPDMEMLEKSLAALGRMGREKMDRLERAIRRLVDSDELLHEAEFDILLQIQGASKTKKEAWRQRELQEQRESIDMGLELGVPLTDLLAGMDEEIRQEFLKSARG